MTADSVPPPPLSQCSACHTPLAQGLLVCPHCGRLVHADELKDLAARAGRAVEAGDRVGGITLWRQSLLLLPPQTRQYQAIVAKVTVLAEQIDAGQSTGPKSQSGSGSQPARKGLWAGLVATAIFILGKAKLLILGITKAPVLFSMLASIGVYWSLWGWKFAVGLVLSIYVHEMGHVVALTRYGIPASAPMFIPGMGALIRLKQYPVGAREDARTGLAGPEWGLGASLFSYLCSVIFKSPAMAAIAEISALLNLFNLIPFASLDGGRGFRGLSFPYRLIIAVLMTTAYFATHNGLLLLLIIVAVVRAVMERKQALTNYMDVFYRFAFLIVALTAVMLLAAP